MSLTPKELGKGSEIFIKTPEVWIFLESDQFGVVHFSETMAAYDTCFGLDFENDLMLTRTEVGREDMFKAARFMGRSKSIFNNVLQLATEAYQSSKATEFNPVVEF